MNLSWKFLGGMFLTAVLITGTYGYISKNNQPQLQSAPVAGTKPAKTPSAPKELITVSESDYPMVGSEGSFWRYSSLEELYQNAEIVAEVAILDQETIPVDVGTVSTRSQAAVKQVFKGESVPDTIKITEVGGVLDERTLPKQNKPGAGMEPKVSLGIVETTLEGTPVMKPMNHYFVFLIQNPNSKWGYNLVGVVQGKLKIDNKTQKIVNTVDSHYIDQDDLYFLQKQMNGKDKSEVESLLKKIK